MPGRSLGIYGSRRNRQYRNAEGPLGSAPVQLTVYGVWLTGIVIGVVVLSLLIATGALGGNITVPPGKTSQPDADTIRNAPEFQKHVEAGARLFQTAGCVACHANNGKSYEGIGPQLSVSNNAGQTYYIHQIVRNGLYPMPAYPATDPGNGGAYLTDAQLYDITTYIRSIRLVQTS